MTAQDPSAPNTESTAGTRRIPSQDPEWYRVVYNLAVLRINRGLSADQQEGDHKRAYADARTVVLTAAVEARRLRNRISPARRRFRRFLRTSAEPASLVLLAGLAATDSTLGNMKETQAASAAAKVKMPFLPTARGRQLNRLRHGQRPDVDAVIKVVEQRDGLAPRVHYNLACYHARRATHAMASQNLEQADREAIEALDALERFAWVAEPSEMIRTLEWALKDPALENIRTDWSPDFNAVVRSRTTKPKTGYMPVEGAVAHPRAPGTLTKQMARRRDDEPGR